jgi:hypothetical protein
MLSFTSLTASLRKLEGLKTRADGELAFGGTINFRLVVTRTILQIRFFC